MQSKDYKFVKKPWGGYLILEKHLNHWLKKLFINKGEQLSLQSHKNRYEIWIVLRGKIRVQKDGAFSILQKGEYSKINKGEKHRVYGLTNAVVLEAAFGKLKEKDIIRYEDKYGRIK
ncbi:MAG: phosphomannose isomerase type II C-terminal cupin domain [Patescibacteria group bacterium]